jgi:uncharacterized protein (TIGR02444 family)
MMDKFVYKNTESETQAASLWAVACSLYACPAVSAQCLSLQEQYGLDVNMLLAAAFSAARYQIWQPAALRQLLPRCEVLRQDMIMPLRQIRGKVDKHQQQQLYQALKVAELAAEKQELELIERWLEQQAKAVDRQENAFVENCLVYLKAAGLDDSEDPQEGINTLAAALATTKLEIIK